MVIHLCSLNFKLNAAQIAVCELLVFNGEVRLHRVDLVQMLPLCYHVSIRLYLLGNAFDVAAKFIKLIKFNLRLLVVNQTCFTIGV